MAKLTWANTTIRLCTILTNTSSNMYHLKEEGLKKIIQKLKKFQPLNFYFFFYLVQLGLLIEWDIKLKIWHSFRTIYNPSSFYDHTQSFSFSIALSDKWHEFSALKSGPYVIFSSDMRTIFQSHKHMHIKDQRLLSLWSPSQYFTMMPTTICYTFYLIAPNSLKSAHQTFCLTGQGFVVNSQ